MMRQERRLPRALGLMPGGVPVATDPRARRVGSQGAAAVDVDLPS